MPHVRFCAGQTGIDPRHLGDKLKALRERSDSGQSFKAGMLASGYILARGDRRDFVVIMGAYATRSRSNQMGELLDVERLIP